MGSMRQLVMYVALGAIGVAALAVGFMGLIGLREGDGLAAGIVQNLQTIGLIVVTAVAGLVSHYMGASQGNDGNGSGGPTPPPAAPGGGGGA